MKDTGTALNIYAKNQIFYLKRANGHSLNLYHKT